MTHLDRCCIRGGKTADLWHLYLQCEHFFFLPLLSPVFIASSSFARPLNLSLSLWVSFSSPWLVLFLQGHIIRALKPLQVLCLWMYRQDRFSQRISLLYHLLNVQNLVQKYSGNIYDPRNKLKSNITLKTSLLAPLHYHDDHIFSLNSHYCNVNKTTLLSNVI